MEGVPLKERRTPVRRGFATWPTPPSMNVALLALPPSVGSFVFHPCKLTGLTMSSSAARGFVAQANAAFVEEDYEQAIELYSQVT